MCECAGNGCANVRIFDERMREKTMCGREFCPKDSFGDVPIWEENEVRMGICQTNRLLVEAIPRGCPLTITEEPSWSPLPIVVFGKIWFARLDVIKGDHQGSPLQTFFSIVDVPIGDPPD